MYKHALQSAAALAVLLLLTATEVAAAGFSDVNFDHKYYRAIDLISGRSIAQGYDDGTFRPNEFINRAEFVKIIGVSAGIYDSSENEDCFSDVPADQWYSSYICSAKKAGLVNGYPDGHFGPDEQINFVEALKIVEKGMKVQYVENTDPWYLGPVNTASLRNLIPLGIDSFDQKLTRGEMADLIARFIMDQEDNLAYFLEARVNFRVSYESIESGLSIESEWFHYLDSLAAGNKNPAEFAANIALPSPPRGRIFRGDGRFTVTDGDQIRLNNGIVAEVVSVSKLPEKDYYLIYFNYYLQNRRINFLPVSLGQKMDDYGIITEVDTLKDIDDDPRYFAIDFKSNGNFNSTADLFDKCKIAGQEIVECYKYVAFEPLAGEKIKTDGIYRIIYPENEEEKADYFLSQMKACIPAITEESGLSPKIGIVPLRLYYDDGRTVYTNRSGIFWPIREGENENIIMGGEYGCYDPVVVHELTHFVILPAPIPPILNEGLAYYLEKRVIDRIYDREIYPVSSARRLTSDQRYIDDETGIIATFLGGATKFDPITVFMLEDKYNQNIASEFPAGINTGISSDELGLKNKNLMLEITHLNRGNPFEVTFNVYHSPPSRQFLYCDENNYRNEYGWQTSDGKFIDAFNFEKYDLATTTQNGINGDYYALNDYQSPKYTWQESYENFYSTAACLWKEYIGNNPEKIKTVFELINEYRMFSADREEDFIPDLYRKLGPEFEAMAKKKGL